MIGEYKMNKLLKIKIKDKTAFLSLNRPKKRNALNPPLIKELFDFFKESKWPPSTRAIVLSGEGPAFCSGADLQWLKKTSAFHKKDLKVLLSLLQTMSACPLPVVAIVKGAVVGGGLGLLSTADVVIAEKSTHFRFSETRLGLVPSIISPFVLKKLGLSWSRFLMLSAKVFSAQTALDRGLIHFIGTKKECALFLKEILQNFKQLEPLSISETKKWLNDLLDLPANYDSEDLKQKTIQLIHESRKRSTTKERIKKLMV